MNGTWARASSAILGAWLFLSIFFFEHSDAQFTNTWICGLLTLALSLLSLALPKLRWALSALGLWIFLTTFALPAGSGEVLWNNGAVGLLVFAFSLVKEQRVRTGPFSHHRRVPV